MKSLSLVAALVLSTGGLAYAKDCSLTADVQQCCSAKKCTGDVLNNKDEHNCKRSGGKSWHPAARGGEPALCRNSL